MKSFKKIRGTDRRRHYERRSFLRLERLEDRIVLSGASPVAVNDLYHAMIDQPLSVASPAGVLSNDTDAEGDALSGTLFSGPANGTLAFNADGSFDYTPNAGFVGMDSFIYYASDDDTNSMLAAVTLNVNAQGTPPQSATDSYNVSEDAVLNIGFTEGVLANDLDAEGNPLTAAVVTGPTNGTLALNADGSFTYIPGANFSGSDSFTYIASDGANDSNVATVNITVDMVNDLPVATNDVFTVEEDGSLGAAAGSVLANDTDIDGDTLSAVLESDVQHGTLVLNADGTFSYTPDADFNGLDGFSYLVNDGQGNSEVASVTINVSPVNDLPEAVNDEYTTDEDAPLVIAAPGVLGNDTDIDGDALSSIVVNPPLHGTLVLNADGSFTYTPEANYNGTDGFSYLAGDGTGDSEVATATITVNPVNDATIGTVDAYATDEDVALTVDALTGVLVNDTDLDGDTLTATLVSGPANGTLTLNADGSFAYTPTANFNGSDTFTYSVGDGTASAEATVTITVNPVNDAPATVNDEYATDEDTPLTIAVPGVLTNDTDGDGDPLTVTVLNQPQHGAVTLNVDGSFNYTPEANFNGVDGFSYVANDGTADSEVATVTITVNPVADAPAGMTDVYATGEDTPLAVDAAGGVLANDTDSDGDPLTATLVSGPANGMLTLNADGSFNYAPNADFSGSDTFVYSASDGALGTGDITVTINVNATNDAPLGVADAYAVDEDGVLAVDAALGVLLNDTDIDGDALAATLVSGPANGVLALNADGSFSYTPTGNFSGSDSFTYSVSDGALTSEATVSITVNPVNDGPTAVADAYTTDEDTVLTVAAAGVLSNDTDPEADPLSAILVSGPASGVLALNADGSFSYTPNADFFGSDSFVYKANDGALESEATVTITVNSFPDAPIVHDDAYSTGEDLVVAVGADLGVLANDFDEAGGALTATLIAGPEHGALTLNADGSFSYAPEANWHGTDTFVYESESAAGDPVQATATIVVEPLNDMPLAAADEFDVVGGVHAGTVMTNDSDVDGDTLTGNLLWGPSHGDLTFNTDGTFSYTAEEGFSGDDYFWYQLNDGKANSAVAKVTLHVGGDENQVPASGEDAYTVEAGQTLTVAAPGVLANDSDAEGDPLSAALVVGPTHGTLAMNADGSFSYTPEVGFTGSDTFTYEASDGSAAGNVATVTLTVTPEGTTTPIEAGDDSYAVAAETTLSVDLPGVLANDVDAEADPLTAAVVAGPANGTLTLGSDGSFSYTPAVGFTGSDSFTYQASDGANISNIATVTIEVGSLDNARPTAGNDSYTVDSGAVLDVPVDQGVLLDDADADGDALAAALFSNPLHGSVTLNGDGSFSYTPEAGYVGLDSFIYWVYDGELHSALAAVTIHVVEADQPGEGELPGEDDCDDGTLDLMLAGDVDPSAIDDVMNDGGWLA